MNFNDYRSVLEDQRAYYTFHEGTKRFAESLFLKRNLHRMLENSTKYQIFANFFKHILMFIHTEISI